MSALIRHFVVHQLGINQQQELVLVPRSSCFDVSPEIEDLAHQINHAFNVKPGKGVGGFVEPQAEIVSVSQESEEESEQAVLKPHAVQFKTLLEKMQSEEIDFVEFSIQASELLKKSLLDMGQLETGFVVFSHYQFLATDYLMIAIINTKQHVEINRELELSSSDHLDLAKKVILGVFLI